MISCGKFSAYGTMACFLPVVVLVRGLDHGMIPACWMDVQGQIGLGCWLVVDPPPAQGMEVQVVGKGCLPC